MNNLFTPAATVNVAASTTSARQTLSGAGGSLRIHNAGTTLAFVATGDSTIEAAAASSTPVPAGAVEIIGIPPGHTHAAAILASGTGTVYFTRGEGE